eukprot:g39089.t1
MVVEMAVNDALDVDGGGMVGMEKEDPITVVEGKGRGEGRIVGDGLDPAEGLVNYGAGGSLVEEVADILEASLSMLASLEQMQERLRNWDNGLEPLQEAGCEDMYL